MNFPREICIVLLTLFLYIQQSRQVDLKTTILTQSKCEESAKYLIDKCENFKRVENLSIFREFARQFNTANECLRSKKRDLIETIRKSEEICESNGILYANVRTLGQLLNRFRSLKPVCTIEFAGKIHRLHHQLEQISSTSEDYNLKTILRSLANRVQVRCRKSLAKRLLSVERRAPDSVKFVTVINGLLNIGKERIERLAIEPEQFVPVLNSELIPARENSIGNSAGGFEFHMNQVIRMAVDPVKKCCKSLQTYHVNILGSIGLLASIGYAAPPTELEVGGESGDAIKRWLLSAILCQSMRGALKMSQSTVEGKNFGRLKVLQLLEADVSEELENDTEFATYKLTELVSRGDDNDDLSKIRASDSYRYPGTRLINLRKLQLLEGPNFRLANALYNYLDVTQKDSNLRIKIPYDIMGLKVPPEQLAKAEDEEEEEEEEV